MLITVQRKNHDAETTLGDLYIDGVWECYTLEDQPQPIGEKVPGETRIPATVTAAGRQHAAYQIALRNEGGMTKDYARIYGDMHRGMVHILDVPMFTNIYIHTGNHDGHTLGCILVGDTVNESGMVIGHSRDAYRDLYPKIVDAAEAGDLWIEVLDEGAVLPTAGV